MEEKSILRLTFNPGLSANRLWNNPAQETRQSLRLIQGCVSSVTARRKTRDCELQRQTKNKTQIDNLFIKPKSKLQQTIHPLETQN